jgi:hypothetical protein
MVIPISSPAPSSSSLCVRGGVTGAGGGVPVLLPLPLVGGHACTSCTSCTSCKSCNSCNCSSPISTSSRIAASSGRDDSFDILLGVPGISPASMSSATPWSSGISNAIATPPPPPPPPPPDPTPSLAPAPLPSLSPLSLLLCRASPLHFGHEFWRRSHGSMHSEWNTCLHCSSRNLHQNTTDSQINRPHRYHGKP